jgi:protein involved in polysaccharide export with SLBB domain
VNDFAGVVDELSKRRLENTLRNLKGRSSIEFKLVTVDTTGGQDIFDFSRKMALDWNIGTKNSVGKTLLLVVAVKERSLFTQFTRAAQTELPDGILGEIRQRMQQPIDSGRVGEGLTIGIQYFVEALAKKKGFSLKGMDESDSPITSIPILPSLKKSNPDLVTSPGRISENPEIPTKMREAAGPKPAPVALSSKPTESFNGSEVEPITSQPEVDLTNEEKPANPAEPAKAEPPAAYSTPAAQEKPAAIENYKTTMGDAPIVANSKEQYWNRAVTVTGFVGQPGLKNLQNATVPLYMIISQVQPRADATGVSIRRSGYEEFTFDLHDPAALNFAVEPGDVINVIHKPDEFYYIGGRINRPGQKPFQAGLTLLQAILAAGGLSRPSDYKIELMREGPDGLLTTLSFDLRDIKSGKIPDPRLQPGDSLEVVD